MNDWLKELKPGDEVFVSLGDSCFRADVEKVTKHHVRVNGEKFSRKDGFNNADTCWLDPTSNKWCRNYESWQRLLDRISELRAACAEIDNYSAVDNVSANLAALVAGLKKRKAYTED